jgi:hypothetical protein
MGLYLKAYQLHSLGTDQAGQIHHDKVSDKRKGIREIQVRAFRDIFAKRAREM